jgi:hypothetical protein
MDLNFFIQKAIKILQENPKIAFSEFFEMNMNFHSESQESEKQNKTVKHKRNLENLQENKSKKYIHSPKDSYEVEKIYPLLEEKYRNEISQNLNSIIHISKNVDKYTIENFEFNQNQLANAQLFPKKNIKYIKIKNVIFGNSESLYKNIPQGFIFSDQKIAFFN